MARKKTRIVDGSTEATDTPEKYDSKGNCPHISKGVDIGGLKKALKKKEDVSCQVCKKKQLSTAKKIPGVESDIWICMNCGHVGCGNARSDHAVDHFNTPHSDCHSVVTVVDTWSMRCLLCRLDINLEVNAKASDAIAYLRKNFVVPPVTEEIKEDNMQNNMTRSRLNVPLIMRDPKTKSKGQKDVKLYPVLGLENIGNTCYLNSVLQCLAQTPGFVKSLEPCSSNSEGVTPSSGETFHRGGGDYLLLREGASIEAGPLTKELHKVLNRVRNGAHLRKNGINSENPSEIIKLIKKLYSMFYVGEQHDSHELLRFLLEGLRNEDLKKYQHATANSKKHSPEDVVPKERDGNTENENQPWLGKLPCEQIFGGKIISILKCLECGTVTTAFETFMDISLPVESEKVKGVERPPATPEMQKSKYQQKKDRKMARRSKKKPRGPRVPAEVTSVQPLPKHSYSSLESGTESEADIEDNLESENPTGTSQDDTLIDSSPLSKKSDKYSQYPDVSNLSEANKDGITGVEPIYPYTVLLFDSSQNQQCGQMEQNVSVTKQKGCRNSSDMSVVDSCSPEPSNVVYGCRVEHPTLAFAAGSPDHSTAEDFGSCDGGRGSPASSIEQADWEVDDEEKKDVLSTTIELGQLTDGIEKELQITPERELRYSPSHTIEISSSESLKEELLPWDVSPSQVYDCLSGRCSPVNAMVCLVPQNPEIIDKRTCEDIMGDLNHTPDTYEIENPIIPDEALDFLVEEVIVEDSCSEGNEEHTDNGHLAESLTSHVGQLDSGGSNWGKTLAPPSALEMVPYSLDHSLRQFFSEEVLSGTNRIGCERCTQRKGGREMNGKNKLVLANALKQLLFIRLPRVLTLHLKRFQVIGSRMSKITRKVSFPLILDVSPYTSAKCEANQFAGSPTYQLYAVVEHTGHMSSGHYVAYVDIDEITSDGDGDIVITPEGTVVNKRVIASGSSLTDNCTSRWVFISDTFVKEITVKEVLDAEAYLLFYKRVE